MMFNTNGSFISRLEGPHRQMITSIAFFPANDSEFIAVADD